MNRVFLAPPLILGILVAQGCGSTQSSGGPSAEPRSSATTPTDIAALFQREKSLPQLREAKAPDGAWSARFPSETEVGLVPGQGHVQAHFSLGTEAETRCFFYQQPIDSGQAIGTVLSSMREKVKFDEVLPYRVTSAQGVPVVFVEGRYIVETSKGKQVGSLKLAVSPRSQTPVLCFLDEPGFTETFASAITGLLGTLTVKEPAQKPVYSEIWQVTVESVPLGFQWFQVLASETKAPGTTISLSAMFTPVGPGELSTTDEVEVFESDDQGIVKGTFFESQDGQVAHDLELTRSGKSKYRVTGKLQGKDFKSEFKAPHLTEDVAFYRHLLDNSKKDSKFETDEYNPSVDPRASNRVSYVVNSVERTVAIQMGGASFLAKLGDEGLPSELSMRRGDQEFKQQIVHRSGSLK